MLVSHEYKFIFIKTKKTAGSSLETYFKPYCEDGIIGKKLSEKHKKASEIKEIVGDEIWKTYTKVIPIRNPWDMTVSLYFWRGRKRPWYYFLWRYLRGKFNPIIEQQLSFEEWIKKKGPNWLNENRDIIYVDGEIDEYEFIRYEHLKDDLQKVCEKLGVPFDAERLGHEKGGIRPKRNYKDFYTEETKEIIAKAYDREIKEFGYTY